MATAVLSIRDLELISRALETRTRSLRRRLASADQKAYPERAVEARKIREELDRVLELLEKFDRLHSDLSGSIAKRFWIKEDEK